MKPPQQNPPPRTQRNKSTNSKRNKPRNPRAFGKALGFLAGTNPLSLAALDSSLPFLSPGGDIFPRPGEVFPLRWRPWQGREVSALYRSAGEGDTFRLRQSLSLSGEVARPEAVTERVACGDEPSQSRCARQLSRRGEPLAKAAGPSPQVNALHPSTYNQYTFPLCQSLSLSGEVARPKAVTERVSCRDEPSPSCFVRQLPRRGSPALIAQHHKI